MKIQKPKGTVDIYGIEALKRQYINNVIVSLCNYYNYTYIQTPVFEDSNLFHHGVGETTDIVTKETYDFIDRGDRRMTLRPEGTAGVVRSFIENKMYGDANQPIKVFYNETMYRYERPQSGRNREFTQFGVEVLGGADPLIDAEVISIPVTLFKLLGLKEIKVNINTLGDFTSRLNYKKTLTDYFKPYVKDLCPDCKERLEKNPLRILDCKVDVDKDFMKNTPKTIDYLTEESANHFNKVKEYLEALGIEYEVNPNIVRGLDYYCHTIFEVEAKVAGFGSQNVLAGGGRYDGLVKIFDGPDVNGVGFALGIDRLVLALEKENVELPINDGIDVFVAYINEDDKLEAARLTQELRVNGFKVDTEYTNRNLKGQFKQADRLKAEYLIIVGEEERKTDILTVKNNKKQTEEKIKWIDIITYLDERVGRENEEA